MVQRKRPSVRKYEVLSYARTYINEGSENKSILPEFK